MSTFGDIACEIIAILTIVTYPILCFLFGFAGMLDSHKQEKKDTSEDVPE